MTFVRFKNFVWGEGFFLEGNWDPKHRHWMSENATILYFSLERVNKTITFEASSFFRLRNLIINLNGRDANSFSVKNVSEGIPPQKISQPLEFEEGLNTLRFSSLEGCEVPSELNITCETDCISFEIGGIEIS